MLEEDASVGEFDEFPLKTTLLIPSDVLMTKFSLGMDWSIRWWGKSVTRDKRVHNFFTGVKAFWLAFLVSLGMYLNNTFDRRY